VEPPPVQESHPAVEDGKVSSNGASTEKEDNKSDKTVAEQTIEPEVSGSDSKSELAKAHPVSPAKHSDEPDKKQSVTNDDSPRSTRYNFFLFYFILSIGMALLLRKPTNVPFL
jgi:epidermal growth factor receptor substrate 15